MLSNGSNVDLPLTTERQWKKCWVLGVDGRGLLYWLAMGCLPAPANSS